ncbi:MAG: N-acetylmuramoyl-L-alanine amidase [Gemmatimonadaceae bacterium]|nr:N-acetylmuramoyl-L-alanine amidase [Gemmatimonadaceae bacterium]
MTRRAVTDRGRAGLAAWSLVLVCAVARPVQAQPDGLHVRTGNAQAVVPWVTSQGTRFLPLARLARALGGTVSVSGNAATLDACGVLARFTVGQRTVDLGPAGVETLRVAVTRGGISGTLVPAEFITEMLPRYGTGVVWDPDERELRRFSTYARRGGASPSSPPAQPSAPVEADAPPPDRAPVAVTGAGDRGDLRPDADARPVTIGTTTRPPAGSATPRPEPPPPGGPRRRARAVVIDAGHGGPDNGMHGVAQSGSRIYEKHITLAVALRVADALRAQGVTVHLTRARDTLIALSDRGRIANQQRADLVLSIHVNAANPRWRNATASRGFETYFLAEAKTEDARRVERMENEAVKFETGANAPRGDPLSFIINDMAQNEHLRESSDLAGEVQRRLRGIHPGTDRGVKQANFAVLRGSFMPAILVELGFGTNPQEATFLSTPARQAELARAISDATVEYLARYERRVGGGTR